MINFSTEEFEDEEVKEEAGYISRCSKIFPSVKSSVCIPKIIMQSWKTYDVPEKWKISPESIKKMMPDWQYVLMNDEDNRNMIKQHFPDFLPYYDSFPHNIMKVDASRYCFLYLYGGLYIDLDFEIQRDLSPLFSVGEIFLVCSGNVSSYYTNSFMASKPRSKFWLEVIEEMKKPSKWYYWGKHIEVMAVTGPVALSRVANRTTSVISIVPKKLVMPCSICNLNCSTCESYLRPLEGSSWIGWDTMFYNFWLCNWKVVVAFLICILFLLLVFWLIRKYSSADISFDPRDFFKTFQSNFFPK